MTLLLQTVRKKMQSAHVHVLDKDDDSDKIWFYYIQIQKYTIHTYLHSIYQSNTSVGKSKKQNNLGIFLVILLEELKVHIRLKLT